MQRAVAREVVEAATVGSVSNEDPKPGDYWRLKCAPLLRRHRDALKAVGQWKSQADLAADIQATTGKSSERALVGHWISGEREPYFSQLIALCSILKLDPAALVAGLLTIAKSDSGRKVINTNTDIPSRSLGKTEQVEKHRKGAKRYK